MDAQRRECGSGEYTAFADKLNLTGKVRCNLLEIAFIVSSLPSSQHVSPDTDRLLALRKAYERLMC